jgi:SAM-dependent methyltransferase
MPDTTVIQEKLLAIAREYPEPLVAEQLRDVPRCAFHLSLLAGVPDGARVADIGGGVGLFSPGAAALGYQAVLVDDFRDPVNLQHGDAALAPHRSRGVEIISRDVIADGTEFAPASLDAVTSFDSLEHWHHSPRDLLRQLTRALKPGGLLILGAPNRVNLRKRVSTLLGRGAWSSFEEWYMQPVFRGHVREPNVAELRRIAADLGLAHSRVIGRNWQGLLSTRRVVRALARVADGPLRLCPALCADIYLLGRK